MEKFGFILDNGTIKGRGEREWNWELARHRMCFSWRSKERRKSKTSPRETLCITNGGGSRGLFKKKRITIV